MTSQTYKRRSGVVSIIDSSDSDVEPSSSEVNLRNESGKSESSTHMPIASSTFSFSSRGRRMSGSARKRRQISSDSSDKENDIADYTPRKRLQRRRADSIEKVKRHLKLEKIRTKRCKSAARKRLDVQYQAEDGSSDSDEHVQVKTTKTPVPAQDHDGNSSDDFESPPNVLKIKHMHNTESEEEDDDLGFIVASESSQEVVVDAGVTFIKDGDFVASRQLNKFKIHELYRLEGKQLTRYQPLKSKIKLIATDEFVQVADDTLDDYIGPILVQHCAPYEDNAIVQIEQELKLVCNTLLSANGGKLLKVAKTSESRSSSAGSWQKLPLKEAHARYVQMILSSLVDDDFLGSLEEEKDHYFAQAKKDVESCLSRKTSLVFSDSWDEQFKVMLENCPILKDTDLQFSVDAKCQACKRNRHITRSFKFYNKSDDEMVKEFRIGCFCADKALLYHRLCHYCTVELKESCSEKLEEEMAEGNDLNSGVVVVQRLCVEDDSWQNELFAEFKKLLNKVDEWAVDGKQHRRMMSSIYS